MYWTLSEIRGLEAGEAGGVGGGYRGQSSLATVWRPGFAASTPAPAPPFILAEFWTLKPFGQFYTHFHSLRRFLSLLPSICPFFCINLKGFPSKSLIFCEVISWCGIALVATSDRGEMELDPLFSSGHLPLYRCRGHTYIVHNQFGTFLPRTVLQCFLFRNECHTFTLLCLAVITSGYQWLPVITWPVSEFGNLWWDKR